MSTLTREFTLLQRAARRGSRKQASQSPDKVRQAGRQAGEAAVAAATPPDPHDVEHHRKDVGIGITNG
jgi:hypothetical protein